MKSVALLILILSSILHALEIPTLDANRIIGSAVGFRPCRTTGIRIEPERVGSKLVIHNYGHCGMGITLSWGSAYETLTTLQAHTMHNSSPEKPPIAVIGAGVIGLSTAHLLLKEGYQVHVYARDFPPYTTSNIAAGLWSVGARSRPQDQTLFERLQRTSWKLFSQLAESNSPLLHGVQKMAIYALDVDPGLSSALVPADIDTEATPLTLTLRDKTYSAIRYNTFRIDVPLYLQDLLTLVTTQGAVLETRTVTDFSEIPEEIIINCTGLGARELAHDDAVYPVRGQLLYLSPQPSIDYMFFAKTADPKSPYVFMLSQESRLVIGVTIEPENGSTAVDEELKDILLAHAQQFFAA